MEKLANGTLDVQFENARIWRRERALRSVQSADAKADLVKKYRTPLDQLLEAALAKQDVDVEGVKKIRAEMHVELQRAADEAKAKAGADHRGVLKNYIDRLRADLEELSAFALPFDPPPPPPFSIVLNAPSSIYATSGLKAVTNIAPLNSTAKFAFTSNASSGYEEVTFSFVWQNPYDAVVVLNVDAYPIFRGYCQADGDSGIFSSGKSNLSVAAELNLFETTSAMPTPGTPLTAAQQQVAYLHADGGSFFSFDGVGDIEWVDVYRGYDMRFEQFTVQSGATLGIDVITSIVYSTTGGSSDVQLEFSQNDRAIAAYAVLLTIVS
jgi:hypothetical protein